METLTSRLQIGGWRHFIGEDEIRCGSLIEVLQDGDWIAGRYEANLHPSLPAPQAYIEIDERRTLTLRDGMPVRWPAREQ